MLTKLTDRRARRRWARAESVAETLDPLALRDLHSEANRLSRRLNRVLRVAESRLSAPLTMPANRPDATHTDWNWQPDLWTAPLQPSGLVEVSSGTRITPEIAMFHDCPRQEITFRQTRLHNATDHGFATTLEVLSFEGSYLSLALDLPGDGLTDLSKNHIVGLTATLNSERALDVYARLNLRHGPNTDHVVAKLEQDPKKQTIEFDLASTRLDQTRLSRAWLDLIIEAPSMNRVTLASVSLNRRPRADI